MINIDNLPLKYLTGSYRFDKDYPSETDFLYDLVQTGKRCVRLDSIDFVGKDTAVSLCESLSNEGFVDFDGSKITVLKTPWDECNE